MTDELPDPGIEKETAPPDRQASPRLPAGVSELVLLGLFIVVLGFTRVYYSSADGVLFVWKGEFSFADTLVDLDQYTNMPVAEMERNHRSVLWQLEDMGMVATSAGETPKLDFRRARRHRPLTGES